MKKLFCLLGTVCLVLLPFRYSIGNINAQQNTTVDPSNRILALSQKKWTWIMDRRIDSLQVLFDEDMISRQPQIRMDKSGHIDVIENGNIRYQHISTLDTDIQIFGDVSILLTTVKFISSTDKAVTLFQNVTEVYKKRNNEWKLILFQMEPV